MTSKELMELDQQYVMNTYGRFPVAIDHGKGATLYGPEGDKYIDFTSGIGVNSLGYGNEDWAKAIYEQALKLGHMSNLYYTEPCVKLAKTLCERSGMSCAFFGNSGAEANEGMIKLARKYSFDKYGEGRSTIITLVNSFHGRTITTLNATGQEVFHNYFFPFTEGFRYAEPENIADLIQKSDKDVCAVMLEVIQGEGGVQPLSKEYVQTVADLCKKNDWLLLIDEVQTGIGRTGSLFAFQDYGIQPDVVSFAKGIAGGLPMGGFLAAEPVRGVLSAGTHASTFVGNPMASAAALKVLETLNEDFLVKVQAKGEYMVKQFAAMGSPHIAGVRGKGLMIGLQLTGMNNAELCKNLMARGVLTLTAGQNVLRLLPPLTISLEEIDEGIEIIKGLLGN